MIKKTTNYIIKSTAKPTLLDVAFEQNNRTKPIVVFVHGFKGFKDWGHFNLVHQRLAESGFVALKFNFSHNGGTLDNPIDFPDLEAFGNNTYTKELDDLGAIIDWVSDDENPLIPQSEKDVKQIYLIGHSRGGGITILKANEDSRVKKIVTWAAVSDFEKRFPKGEELENWKKNQVTYIQNARTKQQMPLYYSFYEDFLQNKDRLNIPNAEQNLKIPHLIIHGEKDEVVNVSEAEYLHKLNPASELLIIPNTGHTFDVKHPFTANQLPQPAQLVLNKTIEFLKK
ncbi:MAG TPA: alpha/beta hydrolase [Flavobacteriales bacterium]|nr:alpha/beta hydrolase [Flavobacteriales bacterium]|tara:strand:+ start:6737 stop:7588 length:852 start_codon:yes stop_codon:yes gene_type:complete